MGVSGSNPERITDVIDLTCQTMTKRVSHEFFSGLTYLFATETATKCLSNASVAFIFLTP